MKLEFDTEDQVLLIIAYHRKATLTTNISRKLPHMTLDKYRIRNVIKIFFDICLREAFENKIK